MTHTLYLNPSTQFKAQGENIFRAFAPYIVIFILPAKPEKLKPFLGLAFSKTPAFFRRLLCGFFPAEMLLHIVPEDVRLHGCGFPGAGSAAQSTVAADYGQSFRRCVDTYFTLNYSIGIVSRAREKDFQMTYIVKFAFVRRTRAVKDNLTLLAGQPQVRAYDFAQSAGSKRAEVFTGLLNRP
jgi:hypothetical protein